MEMVTGTLAAEAAGAAVDGAVAAAAAAGEATGVAGAIEEEFLAVGSNS
jgi:hypothetical protein